MSTPAENMRSGPAAHDKRKHWQRLPPVRCRKWFSLDMRIEYTPPKFTPPQKPQLTGQLSQAWDYLVNRKGLSTTDEFDEDFEPVGPRLREQLGNLGVVYNTSGDTTIMFFG